jgi:steroid 5-alpha reductase family enzyme
MKIGPIAAVLALSLVACPLLYIFVGPALDAEQLRVLRTLGIICGASALYCFVVGQLTHNNSQMDKLWSILPIAYTWVIAVKGSMDPRLVIYAVIVTLWGIRLTVNFARKGAYRLKFWEGEEDYRWQVLRQNKYLKNPVAWALFNLFFISIYQNALVLATCLPALACMGSLEPLGVIDYVAIFASLGFLLLELAADEQQMAFHTTKNNMLREGLRLEDLPAPFNKGFNTTGLWGRARHPNYLGEQGVWLSLYLFAIGAKVTTYAIFHWTMIGPLFLVFLFMGSSAFGEAVSSSKYPEYKYYLAQVSKYIPLWKYNPSKALPEDEAQPEAAE